MGITMQETSETAKERYSDVFNKMSKAGVNK